MNKKLFGIKVSTYLQILVCFIVAFCVWFYAKYADLTETNEAVSNMLARFEYL